jgi:serine/threonine protein kinase/predicted hydrocarbon binding protein
MRVGLVAGGDAMDSGFLEDVLQLAGHVVETIGAGDGKTGAYDAVFAPLEGARELGWLGPGATPPGRAVVVSRFVELLRPLRHRDDLRILLEPSTPVQVLAALGAARHELPDAFEKTFDWGVHDARLAELGLTSAAADAQLGSIATLAATGLHVPIAFVALVDSERQRFLGEHGLPDDLRIAGGTPRQWSFCQHVVSSDAPLVVEDAALVPTLSDSPLVRYGVVRAYAGVPVHADGKTIGTVCVLSSTPRTFTSSEVAVLELAARAAEARITSLRDRPVTLAPSDLVTFVPEGAASPKSPVPALPSAPLVGTTIGDKYLVTAAVAEGGMARVYLARDRQLERLVAVKVLDESLDDRLLMREARQIANIRHPCIMQLFDWGRLESGRPYLVLEYVRGESLRDRIHALAHDRKWMPHATLIRMLRNLSGALETLHGAGLVHGDVKPANVLIDDALDRVVLIDFGLAMNLTESPDARIAGGTLGYSAPEQLVAAKPTEARPSLDVYALGVLAYALLTYVSPFSGLAQELRLMAQVEGAFAAPSRLRPDLGSAVDAVFERALAPDPALRYGTVSGLVDALEQALREAPKNVPRSPFFSAPPGHQATPQSRGVALALIRRFVASEIGASRERDLVASLDPNDREALDGLATASARLVPTLAYSAYLRAYSRGDRAVIFALAERIARAHVPERLAAFQIDRSPHTLLRAAESIFHRVHTWGRLEFTRETGDRSRVELATPRELAPEQCTALAGMLSGTVQWVRRDVRIRDVACVASGARACAFVVEWSAT